MHIIDHGDLCSLTGVIVILLLLGKIYASEQQKKWGGVLALSAFLAYGIYALRIPPKNAETLFHISLRGLAVFGLMLGLSWMVLPLVFGFLGPIWRKTKQSADASKRWFEQWEREQADQERRWRENEAWRQAAPDRERAATEAEAQAQAQAQAQKRRNDARARCELLFLHFPHLHATFPRKRLEKFFSTHMGDDRPPEEVEARGRDLQRLLQQLAEPSDIPQSGTEDYLRWCQEQLRQITALPLDEGTKQEKVADVQRRIEETRTVIAERQTAEQRRVQEQARLDQRLAAVQREHEERLAALRTLSGVVDPQLLQDLIDNENKRVRNAILAVTAGANDTSA